MRPRCISKIQALRTSLVLWQRFNPNKAGGGGGHHHKQLCVCYFNEGGNNDLIFDDFSSWRVWKVLRKLAGRIIIKNFEKLSDEDIWSPAISMKIRALWVLVWFSWLSKIILHILDWFIISAYFLIYLMTFFWIVDNLGYFWASSKAIWGQIMAKPFGLAKSEPNLVRAELFCKK